MSATIESYHEVVGQVYLIIGLAERVARDINDLYCEDHEYEFSDQQHQALRETEHYLDQVKGNLVNRLNVLRNAPGSAPEADRDRR